MNQTKLESLEETLVNVGAGFIFALVAQLVFVPLITGHKSSFGENLAVTVMFTVISIARGYWVRRTYNKHRGIFIKFIRNLFK